MTAKTSDANADEWTPVSPRIPDVWVYASFDEVFENLTLNDLKIPQKEYLTRGRWPVIDQGVAQIGGFTNDETKLVRVKTPLLVFGDHTKCFKYVQQDFAPGADGIKVLSVRGPVHPKFIYYLFFALRLPDRGYSRHFGFFRKCKFPLPPIPEQHRIVAKIEELFSELDAGTASLTRARAQLKTYRQALLKAAFEGKLTAQWRAANAGKLESPETLLARIRKERDARYAKALDEWQTSLSEWRAGGEVGRKPGKPKRFAELTSDRIEITSAGWAKSPLDLLIGEVQQGWSPTCDGNVPVGPNDWAIVKTTAVQHGHYSDKPLKKLSDHLEPRPDIEIMTGDFLMTRKGPRVRTGVVCLVRKTRHRIMLCDTVYRFRCDDGLIYPPLLEHALNSPDTLRELDGLKAGISESGISLNHGKIRSVGVSFPIRFGEQEEVVRQLEAKLSSIDAIESEITTALARITALRQSILKKAFSGQLVPQDPADEPASALLARLAQAPAPKPRRKTKP